MMSSWQFVVIHPHYPPHHTTLYLRRCRDPLPHTYRAVVLGRGEIHLLIEHFVVAMIEYHLNPFRHCNSM
jgi:hypothetical protein